MTETCSLCDLPASPGVTAPDVDGRFCCQGCLDVTRSLGDADLAAEDVRARTERESPEVPADDDLAEAFLAVEGMHCTTCEAFVALQGEETEGVAGVDASYATDTARVTYDPDRVSEADLPDALTGYGYVASDRADAGTGAETVDRATRERLLVGFVLAMLVMPWYVFFLYPSYVGIETGILDADMTTSAGLYVPMTIVALFSAGVVGYTGWPILRGAWISLRTRRPNMDLLLSVAILAAYAYSLVSLASGSVHLYFDVAIAVVLVATTGEYYEDGLKREATGLLSELRSAQVGTAKRRSADGDVESVDVADLEPGDEVLVRPGERVPVDGTVLEGTAAVDEAVITGESLPVTKAPGDDVIGGAVVTDSALVVEVGADGESTLDRITGLVWAVQSERHGAQRFADRLATVFVPLVLVLGVAVAGWRLLEGASGEAALLAGLTVLVAACPCAMGLATPLAVAAGLRDALRRGTVVTTTSLFEAAPDVDAVVFDKTGTLTTGEMSVRRAVGDDAAVAAAATVERRSSHPIADAVVEFDRRAATDGRPTPAATDGRPDGGRPDGGSPALDAVTDFERHPGAGVSGLVARPDGEREGARTDGSAEVVVGTPELVTDRCGDLPADLATAVDAAHESGNVPVVVGYDGSPAAVLEVGDTERGDWAETVEAFDEAEVYVLTGDDSPAAERFREHDAVEEVFTDVPPDGKVATVRGLRAERTVAMVGDGTNDAPALAAADVGIALEGTARAAEAADVVIFEGDLGDVPAAFDLARATRRRIRENVGWALCYNGVAIPLAALGVLNPLLAALAMAASSILVVTNSRRSLLPS